METNLEHVTDVTCAACVKQSSGFCQCSGFPKSDMFSCISPESVTAPARPGIAHSKLRAVFRLTLRIVHGKYAQMPENVRPGHPGRRNSGIIAKRKEPES